MTVLLAVAEEAGTLDEVVAANEHLWPVGLSILAVIGAFVWAARQRERAVAKLGNATLLRRLLDTVNRPARLLSQVLVTLGVAALFGGLLRVQYGGTAEVVPASGLDVVLVVDYSKSMLAQDVYPSRSERLEAELGRFLEDADRRGDRVGVVVFAGQPRGFPITRDSRMLKLYLDRPDPRTENPGGTAIGRALKLALTFPRRRHADLPKTSSRTRPSPRRYRLRRTIRRSSCSPTEKTPRLARSRSRPKQRSLE